jgi:hypothetical protein
MFRKLLNLVWKSGPVPENGGEAHRAGFSIWRNPHYRSTERQVDWHNEWAAAWERDQWRVERRKFNGE